MSFHRSVIAGVLLAAGSAAAGAQAKEAPALGFDAGISVQSSPSLTTIAAPFQNVRLTLPMANGMALEPSMAFNYAGANGNSITTYNVFMGLIDYISGDASAQRRMYVRPFLGVGGVSVSGGGGTSSGIGGAAFGAEARVDPRMAVRWEASYRHVFNTGGANLITGTVGLTFRLR